MVRMRVAQERTTQEMTKGLAQCERANAQLHVRLNACFQQMGRADDPHLVRTPALEFVYCHLRDKLRTLEGVTNIWAASVPFSRSARTIHWEGATWRRERRAGEAGRPRGGALSTATPTTHPGTYTHIIQEQSIRARYYLAALIDGPRQT